MSQIQSPKGVLISKRLWRIKPEEEYIWSMRYYKHYVERPDTGRSLTDDISIGENYALEKQVEIFASFLPDEALINMDDYSPREIECCLLYAKISGMHPLIERRHGMKSDFKLKLMNQLNLFYSALVHEVLSNGGDIIKFSPTSLVVIWKTTKGNFISQNVHIAIDCALVIQKHYGNFILETGEKVRVDLAITAGPIYFSLIGNTEFTRFILFGQVYEEVRKTRKSVTVDNIIVSPGAMQFIHTFEYSLMPVEDSPYFKVEGLTKLWKQVRRNDYLRPIIDNLMDRGGIFISKAVRFFQEGIRDGLLEDEPIENMLELRDVTIVSLVISTNITRNVKKWKATDEILKIIHGIGSKYKGFINYASILESCIMFNIAFGLKGAAHVMQHRSALKCSYEIKKTLKEFPKINTVTLGVGTGRAYFTVVGHSLRQDLSLFSRTILQTNALALAFDNKIVCDQDTFIHSKIKHTCFALLQENMSGADNLPTGLIYELISDDIEMSATLAFSNQPTIGRQKELEYCLNLLKKFIKTSIGPKENNSNDNINAIAIKAYSKEGKTRLMQEIIIKAPQNIPVNYFKMYSGQENIPYSLIRRIFSIDADLRSPNIPEREEKLLKRLKGIPRKNVLWSINKVFQVKFNEAEEFWKLTLEAKNEITKYVLQQLCYKVFVVPWLIMVDDADYVDDDSWGVLESLLQTGTFFFIMTKNRDYTLHVSKITAFVKKSCIARLKLDSLDTSYVCGLICQHLRVNAIPPELEYVLNMKSHSNMGFINNLLINLQQRKFFKLVDLTYYEILKEVLVQPTITLLMRLTDIERERLHVFVAKNGPYDKDEFKRIQWYIFVESLQNESFHSWRAQILEYVMKSTKMPVCILQKNLDASKIPEELSINIRNTQLFERLSYQEQMIMKSCSVLGDTFPRRVLEQVLSMDYNRILEPAVKSFFEAGILCCGRGDFSDGAQYTVIREKHVDPRLDDTLSCKCRGIYVTEMFVNHSEIATSKIDYTLIIPDRNKTLPDYAYCGLLRFRYTQFRENIYNLLRENQQNDIHTKVIMILREETKRCRSCGGDSFAWEREQMRLDDYEENKKQKRKHKSSSVLDRSLNSMDPIRSKLHQFIQDDENFSLRNSTSRVLASTGSHLDLSMDFSIGVQDPQVLPARITSKRKVFNPLELSKLKKNIELVRTFTNCDFTYCECTQILNFYYKEMMVHCKGAGQLMNLLENMQRYAYTCIANKSISEAYFILKQAMICIDDIFDAADPPPKWRKRLMEAKILTISAKAYREVGLHKESLAQLKTAMEKYGLKFPENKFLQFIKYAPVQIEKWLIFYFFPEIHTKKLSRSICEYNNDTAEALNMFAESLMLEHKLDIAEGVALQALFRALNAQTSFIRICDCFSTLLNILLVKRKWNLCIAIEVYALRFCFRKTTRVERQELAAVCRLYTKILMGKLSRAELDYSVHIGFVIIRLSASLNDTESLMFSSSCLISILLSKLYLQEASSLLLELEFCSDNIDDTLGQMWFHSQALLFHIDVGYCIIPYQQCTTFLEMQTIESLDIQKDEASKRLRVLIWLWCLRNEQWEKARRFEKFIKLYLQSTVAVTFRNIFTTIFILEGYLLLLVYKMDRSNIEETRELDNEIVTLIKTLEKRVQFIRVHEPRLYCMKAYYYHIKNNEKKAYKWLKKSETLAKDCGASLIEEFVIHTRKAWNKELPKKKRDFWREHCEENNMIFYQEFDANTDEIGFFTLPTPLYV